MERNVDVDLKAIRNAFAATMKAGMKGGAGAKFNWYPRHPGTLDFPCGLLMPGKPKYMAFHETWAQHGVEMLHFRLELYAAGRSNDAQLALDELLSFSASNQTTIAGVLAANRTLGGLVRAVFLIDVVGPEALSDGADATVLIDIQP